MHRRELCEAARDRLNSGRARRGGKNIYGKPARQLTLADMDEALGAFMSVIEHALADGDEVVLKGWMTFRTRWLHEKRGLNVKTGEPMTIPGSRHPLLRPGENLRRAVAYDERVKGIR